MNRSTVTHPRRLAGADVKPLTLLAVLGLLAFGTANVPAGPNPNPNIAPINSRPHGKSYSQWAAAWWQWAYRIPADENPVVDTTGENSDEGQDGPVWFLAGNFGGTTVREVFVPEDKSLFFPILNQNWVQFPTDPPLTIPELRPIIRPYMDNATLFCEIDGKAVKNLSSYREESVVFTTTVPDGSLLPLPAGDYAPCVDDGYYLMLDPLKKGQHTIHFTGTNGDHSFSLDVTYHINVGTPPHIARPDSNAYGKSLTEWLETYWRWYYTGADPAQSIVRRVQLLPLPAGDYVSGTGTPADPALYRGNLEITLPPGTPFVLPEFAWVSERYNNGTPDDVPMNDAVALAAAHPVLRIDGLTVLSDENKAAFYVPVTPFDPIVVYPTPSSYGSIAALSFQGVGIVGRPLTEGVHVIHLYEPLIIPAGAFYLLPDGLGLIYDNTWTVTVAKPPHGDGDDRN